MRLDFREPQRVRLELSDNGVGAPVPADRGDLSVFANCFEPAADERRGFGLTGLRERIEVLGGKVVSGNRAGGGFTLTIEVPS